MAKALISEIRSILLEDSQPYQAADDASGRAMQHSTADNEHHPNFHAAGEQLHKQAMRHVSGAVMHAKQSQDIEGERKYKTLFVRHRNIRDLHRNYAGVPDTDPRT